MSTTKRKPVNSKTPLGTTLTSALANLKQGNADEYYEIIEKLSSTGTSPQLESWLVALSDCASEVSKSHEKLVAASLSLCWYEDDSTANCYIEYLTSLLSVQTCYLRSVLASLTHHFWSLPVVTNNSPANDCMLRRVHRAVQSVMSLIPTASSILMPLLSKGFPFKTKSVTVQELALRNVLYLTQYCPTLRDSIYELVIHQMLAIDVELPSLEEDEEENEGAQFNLELDMNERRGPLVSSASDGLGSHLSSTELMKNEQAEKLDIMMTVCLHHFHDLCHDKDGSLHYEVARALLDSLIKIFECVLLPTHASSCVQFLLFVLTSWHQDFSGFFLDFLWEKCRNLNTPAVLRQSAAAYISSYIARAHFVSLETAKLCLTVVMEWTHRYLDMVGPESMKPDVQQHGPFYSLCQALFYVFVFRHKEILGSHGGSEFLRRLNFERIITCRLNPLKVCLLSVAEVFASIASQHEIVFCFSILEQNKRTLYGSSVGKISLDSFFPFDPYHLKRSRDFVNSLYRKWEEVEDSSTRVPTQDDDVESLASSLDHSLSSHFS